MPTSVYSTRRFEVVVHAPWLGRLRGLGMSVAIRGGVRRRLRETMYQFDGSVTRVRVARNRREASCCGAEVPYETILLEVDDGRLVVVGSHEAYSFRLAQGEEIQEFADNSVLLTNKNVFFLGDNMSGGVWVPRRMLEGAISTHGSLCPFGRLVPLTILYERFGPDIAADARQVQGRETLCGFTK